MEALRVRDVSFGYPGKQVLNSVGFAAAPGEFLALMGVNGAGKSTLLDIVAGLRTPQSGDVLLKGREMGEWPASERSRRLSHLPQFSRHELPFSVEQIVLMGRYPYADHWFESAEDRSEALEAMRRMDCLQFRERRFATLSGGERQRVLLAACIAQHPEVMLLDEPSTFLDVHQQLQCFAMLAALAADGVLCIAVTHDLNLALTHCTRLAILHEGRLAADFAVSDATSRPEWLSWFSPRLRITHTSEGRPWVLYS